MPKRIKLMKNKKEVEENEKIDENPEIDDDEEIEEDEEIHCTFNNPGKFEPFVQQIYLILTVKKRFFFQYQGWADVISKILSKKPKLQTNQESCILSKATKDYELIEVDQIKRTDKERKEWENLNRLKPNQTNPTDKEHERKLAAIATRGVVQLFNTISTEKEQRRKKNQFNFI